MKTYKSYRKLFHQAGITDDPQMQQVYDFLVQLAKIQLEIEESWRNGKNKPSERAKTSSVPL